MYTDFNILSFKLAVTLLVVFILMILFFLILRRLKGGSFSISRYPLIKKIATLSLAPKSSITLVEVCDQWLLVGVGAENISLISKIDKPAEDSEIYKNLNQSGNRFDAFLSKAVLRGKASGEKSERNE